MSDAYLRKLERDAAAGDLDAEARLLTERVRAGSLAQDRLRLAAYLGVKPAGIAVGTNELSPELMAALANAYDSMNYEETGSPWTSYTPRPVDRALTLWTWGVESWGREPLVRVALAAARFAAVAWTDAFQKDPQRYGELYSGSYVPELLRAVEGWLSCPCESCAGTARSRIDGTRQEALEPAIFEPDYWSIHAAEFCAEATFYETPVAAWHERARARERAGEALLAALWGRRENQTVFEPSPFDTARLRHAIASEVGAWALRDIARTGDRT